MPFLDWVNKAQAKSLTADVPYHLLQFQSTHGDAAADNLLIQGDNLLTFKALVPTYHVTVHRAFIGPPFDTQSALCNAILNVD
jgi:adenine-specific DNA-methyltransferase